VTFVGWLIRSSVAECDCAVDRIAATLPVFSDFRDVTDF
jgi:hypothetical protein